MTPPPLPRLAVAMLTLGVVAAPASAQMAIVPPPPVQSLDVPMMSAATVVTGWVADFEPNPQDARAWITTVAVTETLRGDRRAQLTVRFSADRPTMEARQRTSALLLIAVPADGSFRPTVIDLSDRELAVMTADLRLLRTPDEVLQAARAIVARTTNPRKPQAFGVPVQATRLEGTPLDNRKNLYPRSDFVFVDVPVDERLERRARDELKSEEPLRRRNAAEALRHFPGQATIDLLEPLLEDGGWEDQYRDRDNTFLHSQFNNVRRAAFATLRSLGAKVEEPSSLRPQNPDEQVMSVALDSARAATADIRNLGRYPNLTHLYLAGQSLTIDEWAMVGQLRTLEALFIEGSNVSDSTLPLLSDLHALRYLGLGNTDVTDTGLMVLARFGSLKKADLGQRVTARGIAALAKARPDILARPDEFAFLAPLRPRRVEQPFLATRNLLLPVGDPNPHALGLRGYALIFPPETAGKVDELLGRELPPRGWRRVPHPGYQRNGVPVLSRTSRLERIVDEVTLDGRDWPLTAVARNERMIVVAWNVDPSR
jgi:hypothetical protein